MKDKQRQRVYNWEESQWWWKLSEKDMMMDTVKEVEDYVRFLLDGRGLEVTPGYGRRRGGAFGYQIRMPKFTRHPAYICHEVAHCEAGVSGHGAQFMKTYIRLLTKAGLGLENATRMSAIDCGIEVS